MTTSSQRRPRHPLVHEMARQNGQKVHAGSEGAQAVHDRGLDVAVHSITTAKEQHLY